MSFSKLNNDLTSVIRTFLKPKHERAFIQAYPDYYFCGRTSAELLQDVEAKQEALNKELFDVLERLYTVQYTEEDAVRMFQLLKCGGEAKQINDTLYSPLVIAIKHGDIAMVDKLISLEGCDLDSQWVDRGEVRNSPLLEAIQENRSDIVRKLIDAGVDVKKRYWNKRTLLHVHFLNHTFRRTPINEDIVRMLVESGVDINATNDKKRTVLYDACLGYDVGRINLLLSLGARVNECELPLDIMVSYGTPGNSEMLEVLCAAGVDVDQIDPRSYHGETPLHRAASSTTSSNQDPINPIIDLDGVMECARILCRYGANVHALNPRGETPAQITDNAEFKALMEEFS